MSGQARVWETAQLILRPWSDEDAGELHRLFSDPAVAGGRNLPPARIARLAEWSLRQWRVNGFGPWAAVHKGTGAWVGRIGLDELEDWPGADKVEVGFELHRAWWGQGLATEGGAAALRFGFEERGLEQIISVTAASHAAARRVMEKVGLGYQGTRYWMSPDVAVVWYAIDRASWRARVSARAEIDALLDAFLRDVRAILAHRFVGLYLIGSLALGDFDPAKSDVDFVVVTDGDLPDDVFRALAALHARLAAGPSKWGRELEGSYLPLRALRRQGVERIRHPHVERGTGRLAVVAPEAGYWVIHRWMLREHEVVLAGPALGALIDPVRDADLREAVRDVWREWWRPMLSDPHLLQRSVFGYRCYAVLTMCRMLYTLERGTIVSKPAAARWAQAALPPRWRTLIDDALVWSPARPPDLEETLAFIRYTGDAGEAGERPVP